MGTTLMVLPEGVKPTYVYVPDGFEGEPTDVNDVLRRTYAGLQEEGRWVKGQSFRDLGGDTEATFDANAPFCGSWSACLTGMVTAVSVGVQTNIYGDAFYSAAGRGAAERLRGRTTKLLDAVAGKDGCVRLNDAENTTRWDVLALINRARTAYMASQPVD